MVEGHHFHFEFGAVDACENAKRAPQTSDWLRFAFRLRWMDWTPRSRLAGGSVAETSTVVELMLATTLGTTRPDEPPAASALQAAARLGFATTQTSTRRTRRHC